MGESVVVEVVAASVAGAFSASALYPLEVLKTKMQAESKATTASTESESEDSQESDASLEVIENTRSQQEDDVNVNSSSNRKPKTMVKYAQDMYAKDGITPFYAGIGTSAFQSSVEKALYFFAYTALKNVHGFFSGNHSMGTTMNLLLGCLAEWAHLPITLPIDCLTTQIQTGDNGSKGPIAILTTMLGEGDGLKGMYKGIQAYTVLCLKPSIQYTVFEQVKGILIARKRLLHNNNGSKAKSKRGHSNEALTASEAFLLGMVARTIATVAVYPYLRAKVMLQSQKDVHSAVIGEKIDIRSMIVKMYSNGGIGECFQGIGPELTRGVFSAALMLMCKEKISFAVKKSLS